MSGLKCWASCLGGCDPKISREHYLSANILGDGPVRLKGLSWCRSEFREISAASCTRKILCERHNRALSPLDEQGGNAWKQLHIFSASAAKARTLPAGARPTSFRIQTVDGAQFERWFLKTVIDVAYLDDADGVPWVPPTEWVEIVYGRRPFPSDCGLYMVNRMDPIPQAPDLYFALKINRFPGTERCGGQVKIGGWELVLSLIPLREHGLTFHPRFMKLALQLRLFRVLRFDWPGSKSQLTPLA